MAPINVRKEDESVIWTKLYGSRETEKQPLYKEGDVVRISKAKSTFEKGYLPNSTEEVFKILSAKPRAKPIFQIRDLSGESIKGSFYSEELQKIRDSGEKKALIDKVIQKRKRKGKLEYFVQWQGLPSKFNKWISAAEVQRENVTRK